MHRLAITIDCGGQCTVVSSFQAHHCEDLVSELGIPQCNQAQCSPRLYNLSACTNAENEVNIIDITIQNSVIDVTAEQPQANTPTTVLRTMEQSQASSTTTVPRTMEQTQASTEAQNVSCTTNSLPVATETQYHIVIGILAGLVIVLLVMSIVPWVLICLKLNVTRGLKRHKQQAR